MRLRTLLNYIIHGAHCYAIYDNSEKPVAVARGESRLRKVMIEFNGGPMTVRYNESDEIIDGVGQNCSFHTISRGEARRLERELADLIEKPKKEQTAIGA